ncbi:unnamed protein product [Rangifer tarandus platyrhynchus]|uniref:Uncharacterized protein n=2 Tax=Rangifer tarandus platyrhynchus TaxID=3082113 RepID=A0ACB0FI16_RANTA|nr:unnamed protein product [Rangifer tarandus platyrhynchus]CAI9712329.1 unnamed protein product [Rangifer tarandus platyrhynchus]
MPGTPFCWPGSGACNLGEQRSGTQQHEECSAKEAPGKMIWEVQGEQTKRRTTWVQTLQETPSADQCLKHLLGAVRDQDKSSLMDEGSDHQGHASSGTWALHQAPRLPTSDKSKHCGGDPHACSDEQRGQVHRGEDRPV